MARRPFDPRRARLAAHRVPPRRRARPRLGAELVAGADVVVHLAFIIFGGRDETRGSTCGLRNVFEAAVAAGARRLVYTSSVAAYGFHDDNPDLLTEDVPPRNARVLLLGAEGRAGGAAGTTWRGRAPTRTCSAPASCGAATRRRLMEGFTGQTILGPRVRSCGGRSTAAPDRAGAAGHRYAVPARAPRRRRHRGAGGREAEGPGLQPGRGRRSRSATSQRRSAGARSRSRRGARRARRGRRPRAPGPEQARWINVMRKPVLMDTARRAAPCAGAEARCPRRLPRQSARPCGGERI